MYIQNYDGLDNVLYIERNPNPALEVTLGSSTGSNLGHDQNICLKNVLVCGILAFHSYGNSNCKIHTREYPSNIVCNFLKPVSVSGQNFRSSGLV